jgi:hypothetical protein
MNNDSLRYFVVEIDENGGLIVNDFDSTEDCTGELVEHISAEALIDALNQV